MYLNTATLKHCISLYGLVLSIHSTHSYHIVSHCHSVFVTISIHCFLDDAIHWQCSFAFIWERIAKSNNNHHLHTRAFSFIKLIFPSDMIPVDFQFFFTLIIVIRQWSGLVFPENQHLSFHWQFQKNMHSLLSLLSPV